MNQAALKALSTSEYWEARYNEEGSPTRTEGEDNEDYEWFKTYTKLKPFLEKYLPSTTDKPKILHLGCGTSTLTTDLYGVGYTNQVSIDFSRKAIEIMAERSQGMNLKWAVMDVRKMDFPNSCFETAIDKGTLDAMLHGSLWDPEEDVKQNVGAYIDEVARVLKPGGRFLYITYRQPHFLKPLLARASIWSLQVETLEDVPGSFEYFGFVMDKLQVAQPN